MNLENICYIVGAASLDGVRLSSRPGDYVIAADGGYRTLKARGIEPDFVTLTPSATGRTTRTWRRIRS